MKRASAVVDLRPIISKFWTANTLSKMTPPLAATELGFLVTDLWWRVSRYPERGVHRGMETELDKIEGERGVDEAMKRFYTPSAGSQKGPKEMRDVNARSAADIACDKCGA